MEEKKRWKTLYTIFHHEISAKGYDWISSTHYYLHRNSLEHFQHNFHIFINQLWQKLLCIFFFFFILQKALSTVVFYSSLGKQERSNTEKTLQFLFFNIFLRLFKSIAYEEYQRRSFKSKDNEKYLSILKKIWKNNVMYGK